MHPIKRHSLLIALSLLCIAAPAVAASDWQLEFAFDGPGNRPAVNTMRNYILGCVPNGSGVNPPLPGGPQGPFHLTTPLINGHEIGDAALYNYLNNCNLKPASVTGVAVMGED